jgi:hypothetical protein
MPEHREWVIKNPDNNNGVVGFQIQPFDAPRIITCGELIKASTTYERYADFINFNLGLPGEDKENSFSKEELEALFTRMGRFTPYANVMGIDVGVDCHVMMAWSGRGEITWTSSTASACPWAAREAPPSLPARFNVRITVMDSQPYFDMLMRLQASDINLWGALYSQSKDLDVYSSTIREAEPEKGRPQMRQVDMNRNKALRRPDGLRALGRGRSSTTENRGRSCATCWT